MPSREGLSHDVSLAPPVCQAGQSLWICRYTGALYPNYEEYLKTVAGYRSRTWECKHTGASCLSFEEALASETRSQVVLDQFPQCFEGAVARLVQHATVRQEELSQRIVSYFKEHYVEGEEVFSYRDGKEAALRIAECKNTAESTHDAQVLCAGAIFPPDPEDDFQIEWLSDYTSATVRRKDLYRHQLPLSRNTVKGWLQLSATAETAHGIKGIACIWKVKESLQQQYGLEAEISGTLKDRLERAQQRKEQAKRPKLDTDELFYEADIGSLIDGEADDRDGGPNYVPSPGSRKARSSIQKSAQANAESNGKVLVPVESASQVRARQKPGTMKRIIFDALEAAGKAGLSTAEIADLVQASGVKTWEAPKSAHSSINATCSHDLAFKRTGPGRFVLRLLLDKQMQVPATSAMVKDQGTPGDGDAPPSRQIERNNFKCSKCLKANVTDNSPLVLCDGCPRSYHLSCLGLSFEELPEEDWHCPKCQDRKTSTGRRITSSSFKNDIYEQFDSDREDGKGGSDSLLKTEERGAGIREDPKLSREQARLAARWAVLHPTDDLETLEDEEYKLAQMDTEALAIAEEAERAAAKANPKNDQRHADRVARLRKKAEGAKKRAAALRLVIEGPVAISPGTSSASSMTALFDALTVVDFITTFGASIEAPALSLLDVQQMAAFPLDTPLLGQCYVALLRCLLREAMGMEGVVKSRAKRWTNCLDEITWPEILRRYLLASRVGMSLPEILRGCEDQPDTAILDDDSACIVGAKLLAKLPFYRLPPGMHLRLLAALCSDVSDCTLLRNEINARIEEMIQLQAEFRQRQVEDKKRLKTEIAKPVEVPTTDANVGASEPGENAEAQEDQQQENNQESPGDNVQDGVSTKDGRAESDEEISTASEGEQDQKGGARNKRKRSREASKSLEPEGKDEDVKEQAQTAPTDNEPAAPAIVTDNPEKLESDVNNADQWGAGEGQRPQQEEDRKTSFGDGHDEAPQGDQAAVKAEDETEPKGEAGAGVESREQDGNSPDEKLQSTQADEATPKAEPEATAKENVGPIVAVRKGKRKTRKKAMMQKKQAEVLAVQSQERQYEEELREREAALEEAMDARAIRGEPLGQDRHHRSYWWFPGEPAVIFVEEADGSSMGVVETQEELLNLMDRLNQLGLREKVLYQALQKRYEVMIHTLGHRAVNLDIKNTSRPPADVDVEQGLVNANQQALCASVKRLSAFLGQFESIAASPATTTVAVWKERLAGVQSSQELLTVTLELEADINNLSTGLPTGADDASLAGFSKRKKAAVPSLPLPTDRAISSDLTAAGLKSEAGDISRQQSAQPDAFSDAHPQQTAQSRDTTTLPQSDCPSNPGPQTIGPADGGPASQPGRNLVIKTSGLNGAETADSGTPAAGNGLDTAKREGDTPRAMPGLANGFSQAVAEDRPWVPMPPAQFVKQLFQNEELYPPGPAVQPPEELDASDTEASKNKRGGMVWRSARERRVWLRDVNFALECGHLSRAAYMVAALVDRSQQLLRSLERASKRAEREVQLEGDDPGISDDDEKTEDEMPAKEFSPKPVAALEQKDSRPFKSRHSAKQQDSSDPVQPRTASRKQKRPSEVGSKANGRSSQTPQPAKRPRLAAKSVKAGQEKDEAAKLIEDVMAIANGGVPPAATWIPTEQGRWSATCLVCGEPGDLLCCDAPNCTVAQHIACAGLDEAPANDIWYCEQHRNRPSSKRARSAAKKPAPSPELPNPKKQGAKSRGVAQAEKGKKAASRRSKT